jgi:hypothetical protein
LRANERATAPFPVLPLSQSRSRLEEARIMSLTRKSLHGARGAAMALAGFVACSYAAWAADIPSAPFETVPAGEAGKIDETAALTVKLQDKRAATDENQKGQLLRGVHPKSHGCVAAEFAVKDNIEEKYRVGLFAQPGKTHEAWIRFSNASVLREHDLQDGKNGSRGMAIKVMDVEGDMLSKDDGQSNQDFLMINTPEFAFANVRDYHRLTRVLMADAAGASPDQFFVPFELSKRGILGSTGKLKPPADNEPANVARLRQIFEQSPVFKGFSPEDFAGTMQSIQVVGKIKSKTVRNPLQVQYFGAAPFLFGAGRAMQFSAAPCTATEQKPFDPNTITDDEPSKNYLREELSQTMKGKQDVCYDFKVQVRGADSEDLNIEDATTTWNRYVDVARITIKVPQSPDAPEAIEHCEKLAFTPWHSLADHQPLGGINRLRRKVYSNSAEHRGAGGY